MQLLWAAAAVKEKTNKWRSGLVPKTIKDMKNRDLPKPSLKAYACTEWTFDTPKRPNGTDLWATYNPPYKVRLLGVGVTRGPWGEATGCPKPCLTLVPRKRAPEEGQGIA